jgi:hypothetical protein
MYEILVLLRLASRNVKETSTYIVCETRYHGDPDLVGADRQVRICSDEEVVEQAHVCHGLIWLGVIVADACRKITYECARRRTQVHCLLWMWGACRSLSKLYNVCGIVTLQAGLDAVVAFRMFLTALDPASFAVEASAARLGVSFPRNWLTML